METTNRKQQENPKIKVSSQTAELLDIIKQTEELGDRFLEIVGGAKTNFVELTKADEEGITERLIALTGLYWDILTKNFAYRCRAVDYKEI